MTEDEGDAFPPTQAASRAARRAQRPQGTASNQHMPDGGAPDPYEAAPGHEPVVIDIAPPRWFATLARVSAVLCALAGVGTGIALVASGAPVDALLTALAGLGLAVLMYDVADRRAWSDGDVLHLHQWYRERTLHRDEIDEFGPARASFVRWDIVAVRIERRGQVRLWVTRMLPAGRRTRTDWLDDLERWRTRRSRPTGGPRPGPPPGRPPTSA